MDFCNCQYQTDAENIYYGRICLPIAVAHFGMPPCAKRRALFLRRLPSGFLFLLKDQIALIGLVFLGKSVAVDD